MVDAKARQDCIKEIELLQSLDHPNIIKYLASFVENNEVRVVVGWLGTVAMVTSPVNKKTCIAVHCAGTGRSGRPVSDDQALQETEAAYSRAHNLVKKEGGGRLGVHSRK